MGFCSKSMMAAMRIRSVASGGGLVNSTRDRTYPGRDFPSGTFETTSPAVAKQAAYAASIAFVLLVSSACSRYIYIPYLHQFEHHFLYFTVLYGGTRTRSGTSSYKRECGTEMGNIHTPTAVDYHKPTAMWLFMIGHSLGRMCGGQGRAVHTMCFLAGHGN